MLPCIVLKDQVKMTAEPQDTPTPCQGCLGAGDVAQLAGCYRSWDQPENHCSHSCELWEASEPLSFIQILAVSFLHTPEDQLPVYTNVDNNSTHLTEFVL